MSAFGGFFMILRQMIDTIITIYIYIVIARAIVSWVSPDPYNPIVRFLHNATDPVLYRIRRLIPLQMGGFDFSPILLLFFLYVLQWGIDTLLVRVAYGI